jgi:ribosomal-protein-alanine N-acetyltransferase
MGASARTAWQSRAVTIRPLTQADARAIATWRYPGRYSTYDVGETPVREPVWAVTRGEELVGYCCIGPGARVPGIDEEEGTIDVGYGMRPDLMGEGYGRAFVGAILEFVVGEFAPQRLRLLILSWNERSRNVAEALGFEHERTAPSVEGDFLVMTRPARA